jgi:flagellar hook-basal body complex protein FliE
MKQKFLLLGAALMMSATVFAQWTKPVPSSTQDMIDDGETIQFLYNPGAGGFLAGANDYNTRASVAAFGDSIRMAQAFEDEEKTVPLGTWNIGCWPSVKNAWLYVSCNAWDAMWVDAPEPFTSDAYPGTDGWIVEKQGNSYKFKNNVVTSATAGYWGVAEVFKKTKGDTRLYIYDGSATYTDESGDEILEDQPVFEGAFYDEWVFISVDEYKTFQPKVAAYQAALKLKATLDAAKAEYSFLDFSAPEAVYNNTGSTAEQLAAAEAEVTAIIVNYKASLASFDEPLDLTDQIGDGSSVTPWIQEFTGSGTTGSHTTNTWSTEADNGGDGTDMTTPFIEHWTGSGGILSDQKIYQKLTALAPGLYKFTVDARVYSEAEQLKSFEGIKMFFGNDSINLQDEVDLYYSGSKSVLWSKNYFSIIAILPEAGDVELGFDIKNANFNWLAFKNTSLTYYGNENCEENALKLFKAGYKYDRMSADTIAAQVALVDAFNAAVDAFDAATTKEDIKAAAAAADAAEKAVKDNVAAYEKIAKKIGEWEASLDSHTDLAGEEWDAFSDFMQIDNEEDGADFTAEHPEYPTPIALVLQEKIENGEYPLNTEEINAYISTVDSLYSSAVAHSLVPGTDCTDMLTNPAFGSNTGSYSITGWTGSAALGGLSDYMCAERYDTTVDFYQTVKGAPAGLYKIETHAFVRPAANGGYDGTEDINCWLYMNNFRSTVQNIMNDVMPADQAVDHVNCYLDMTDEPYWPSNTWTTGYDYEATGYNAAGEAVSGWVPNCMIGAAYAFRAGRYAVSTYGLVGDGEDMKIGITSDGQKVHWFLFSGFKLTYVGKDAEAINEILPTYVTELENYLNENSSDMTQPVVDEATKVLDKAQGLIGSADADALWEALQATNNALTAAKANKAACDAYKAAYDDLMIAASDAEANIQALQKFSEEEETFNNYADLTTEEIVALTEKAVALTADLKMPNGEASDENPLDYTALITNPDFEDGNNNGWAGTAPGGYSSGTPEIYNQAFDIHQTLHLPAGTFQLSVQAFNRKPAQGPQADYDAWKAGEKASYQNAYLYATVGEKTYSETLCMIAEGAQNSQWLGDNWSTIDTGEKDEAEQAINVYTPQNLSTAHEYLNAEYDEDGNETTLYLNTLTFTLAEASDVVIGLKALTGDNWCAFDNWHLLYFGTESSKEDSGDALVIDGIANNVPVEAIYTVSGTRVSRLQKGVNIVRLSNGTIQKVLVK